MRGVPTAGDLERREPETRFADANGDAPERALDVGHGHLADELALVRLQEVGEGETDLAEDLRAAATAAARGESRGDVVAAARIAR